MNILALELSGSVGSIAYLCGDEAPLTRIFASDRKHSGLFFTNLEELWSPGDACDLLVVGLGPGSYAGVRVAISTAIGLRFASGAKLVGLPSICALGDSVSTYQVIGDARRESFFHATIRNGRCVEGPTLHREDELRVKIAANIALPVFATKTLPQFPAVPFASPSALVLARLAKNRTDAWPDCTTLEPIYLRDPHVTVPARKPLFVQ